jgi:hypothetical protein
MEAFLARDVFAVDADDEERTQRLIYVYSTLDTRAKLAFRALLSHKSR